MSDNSRKRSLKEIRETAGIPLFRRGINLGNFLESEKEGLWSKGLSIQDEWFTLLKYSGFDHVRIPVNWSSNAGLHIPYQIDKNFLKRVVHLVDTALARELIVIINQHHYHALMHEPEAHRKRFRDLWYTVARHFQGYPEELFFELLNEPVGNLTAALWNQYLLEAHKMIRSVDQERILIIGPTDWNNIPALDLLDVAGLADDRRIIITFHYYEPHFFTHQGARWVDPPHPTGAHWTGSVEERLAVEKDFDLALGWAQKQERMLFLGEFGGYQKFSDMDEVALWIASVRHEAEKRDIPWCFWEFCLDFGVWDPANKVFRDKILRALIP
jgi:endoglucanase